MSWLRTIVVLLLSSLSLWSQESAGPLARVVEMYNQGNYLEAADSARSYLLENPGMDVDIKVQLLIYLSFSLVALGREAEAEKTFVDLIYLDPQLELNPEFVSPKIIDVFRRAKVKIAASRTNIPSTAPLVKKAKPAKAQVLWRSLLWPGWGQRYRGSRLKGTFLQGASIGATAGWGISELGTRHARRIYLASTDPQEIVKEYQTYNRWYRARNFAINIMGAIWLYNIVEVLIVD